MGHGSPLTTQDMSPALRLVTWRHEATHYRRLWVLAEIVQRHQEQVVDRRLASISFVVDLHWDEAS